MYSQSLPVFWEKKPLSPFCEYDVLCEISEQEHTTFVVNFTLICDVYYKEETVLWWDHREEVDTNLMNCHLTIELSFTLHMYFCCPDGLVSEVACRLENGLYLIFLYHIKHLTFNQSNKILAMKHNSVVSSYTCLIEWQPNFLYAKKLTLLHIVSQSSMMRGWAGSSFGKVFGIHSCLPKFNAQHSHKNFFMMVCTHDPSVGQQRQVDSWGCRQSTHPIWQIQGRWAPAFKEQNKETIGSNILTKVSKTKK